MAPFLASLIEKKEIKAQKAEAKSSFDVSPGASGSCRVTRFSDFLLEKILKTATKKSSVTNLGYKLLLLY